MFAKLHFAGAAAAGQSWSASRRRLIKTGADHYIMTASFCALNLRIILIKYLGRPALRCFDKFSCPSEYTLYLSDPRRRLTTGTVMLAEWHWPTSLITLIHLL